MTREDLTQKAKSLFDKAKAARVEGKQDMAKSFRAGARRVQRQIKDLARATRGANKKAAE